MTITQNISIGLCLITFDKNRFTIKKNIKKKKERKRNQHENVKDMVHTTEHPTLNFKKEIYINIITLTQ